MKRTTGRLCRNDVDVTGTVAVVYEPGDDRQIIGAATVPQDAAPFDGEPYQLRLEDGTNATVFVASDEIHPVSNARKLGLVGKLDGDDANGSC